ncbi:MAG TPA: HD domain-containing phosphohydrolase, partial [Vicinamibacteria bacterium]|nr:HD domain-containing phosphohydrolase [Vicinamibacteria bacterium]
MSRSQEILELDQKALQQDSAKSLSQQVAVYVRSLQSQVTTIARTLEVTIPKGKFKERLADIGKTRSLERYVGGTSPFYTMSVVDTSCSGERSGVQLPEPEIQEFLHEGCVRGSQGKPLASHPVVADSLQEPVIVFGEPLKPGDGPVVGVVLAVASMLPVWEMTKEMAHVGTMEVYIVDGRGYLIAHSDPKKVTEEPDQSSVDIVKQFLLSRGLSSTSPFTIPTKDRDRPLKMLGTYTRVPDESGWGVIVQVDEDKAYHSALEMRNESLLLVGAVAVLAVALGTLFAGAISRPIRELAQGAHRLAGGDYGTRVQVKSRNEVGVLAEAFNQMGAEIQKSIEEIRQAARTNKELFMGAIRMLATAIDEKDPYTRGHSERVAFYSSVIAKHLGMPDDEVERVHLSGILHDVGKIGIEDKILRKAAALTDEEYEIMKQHPRKGEHILNQVPALKEMAGAGLQHHENVDGSGYPDALKGDQIPLLGRIVSVADAFDAMTTDRPYSKAMTFEAALARLRFLAGKKFD